MFSSQALSSKDTWRAIGVGVGTAVLLSAIMVPMTKLGISPFPKLPSLAFAETILGPVPLQVGLLFHVIYITFWSYMFVRLFRNKLTFKNAALLATALWVVVLVIFFPIIGWGFLGLSVSPKLIVAAFIPHALFALFLWGLSKLAFKEIDIGFTENIEPQI